MNRWRRKLRCYTHQHDDGWEPLVRNPNWYDKEGHWHPGDLLDKCKYCGRTQDPMFPVSNGPIA